MRILKGGMVHTGRLPLLLEVRAIRGTDHVAVVLKTRAPRAPRLKPPKSRRK